MYGGGPTSAGLRRKIDPGVPRLPSAALRFAVERHAGVGGDRAREVGRSGPVVAHRVAGPEHAVARFAAEQRLEEPAVAPSVHATPTFGAQLFRSVSYAPSPSAYWVNGGACPVMPPGLKDVAHAGSSPDVGDRRLRVAVVPRIERQLQVVAQAEIHRERRLHAPGVGDEEAVVDESRALHAEAEEHVLVGVLVEPLFAVIEFTRPVSTARDRAPRSAAPSTRRRSSPS